MKKRNLRIIKFISVLLLIFSFNLSVNAETTKIYYADENGFRKVSETAPEGFTKNEGGAEVTGYITRTVTGEYEPTKYYACAANAESTVIKNQTVPCGSEGSTDPTLTYTKEEFYSCAKTPSDSVDGMKTTEGSKCTSYSDWSDVSTTACDTSKPELCKSQTKILYYWYKEVSNATTIDFSNNTALYEGIKATISKTVIKDAEINYLENENEKKYIMVIGDISKIKTLRFKNGYPIVTIDELSKFTGLEELVLKDNKIEKIDAIKYLTNLKRLNLSKNAIVSVEPIIGLKKLESLDLSYNEIINLNLLKKIENYNSIEKNFYYNDFKKSGLIKNWAEFADELTNYHSGYGTVIKYTKDYITMSYQGAEYGKFEVKNNILKFVSGKSEEAIAEMLEYLEAIGYSYNDLDKASLCEENDLKCHFSKFGDYLKLNVTYKSDNQTIDKIDFSFDLRYFFGDNVPGKNPKTGVSNALALLGITLLSSAIGFMVLYKHKTGIQL